MFPKIIKNNRFFFEALVRIMLTKIIIMFSAGIRSVSAVDTAAAQRARARAQYSNLARLKVTSGTASLRKFFFLVFLNLLFVHIVANYTFNWACFE